MSLLPPTLPPFFHFFNVLCVHVCGYMVHAEDCDWYQVSSSIDIHFYNWRQGLSLDLELVDQARQACQYVSGILLALPPQSWDYMCQYS